MISINTEFMFHGRMFCFYVDVQGSTAMLCTIISLSCPSQRREETSWGQPLFIRRLESASVNWGTTALPLIIRLSISRLQDN